jgi:hypothetical protein
MTPEEQLRAISTAIKTLQPIVTIDAELKLTKMGLEPTKAVFVRDLPLEASIPGWIEDRLGGGRPGSTPGYTRLIAAYLEYDRGNLSSLDWPKSHKDPFSPQRPGRLRGKFRRTRRHNGRGRAGLAGCVGGGVVRTRGWVC